MTNFTADGPHLVCGEHRGWKLKAQWLTSVSSGTDGWVCYASRPTSAQDLNIGRWPTSEAALEHGRAYVDRQLDSPALHFRKMPVLKRRH